MKLKGFFMTWITDMTVSWKAFFIDTIAFIFGTCAVAKAEFQVIGAVTGPEGMYRQSIFKPIVCFVRTIS